MSESLLVANLGLPAGMAGWQVLQTATASKFTAFTNDPVLKRDIAYFEAKAPTITSAKQLLADPTLENVALTAFGLTGQIGQQGLMEKVLNSAPGSTTSFAAKMTASAFQKIATAFNFGGTVTPAVPAVASTATVTVSTMQGGGLSAFTGNFAGITLSGVDLSGAATTTQVAATLQAAFQRNDANSGNITVKAVGFSLVFSDAAGRGTAKAFRFTAPAGGPTVSAPTATVAGSAAVAQVGGPAVTSPAFISQVVQQFTAAEFQQVVGNQSNTLRSALYAQQQLPTITNWYSVIASVPLANVVQTALNLPASFGALNVDQQVEMLKSKMNIGDFSNPAKLGKFLDQYVATSMANGTDTADSSATVSPALTLLSGITGSGGSSDTIDGPTLAALLFGGLS